MATPTSMAASNKAPVMKTVRRAVGRRTGISRGSTSVSVEASCDSVGTSA